MRDATAITTRELQAAVPTEPPPRRRLRRRQASRALPPARGAWAAELVRLRQIGVWLRRITLDDLGTHVPTTVRVASRAATGPHIAGLEFEPADRTAGLHEPRIGVDLQAVVDGADRGPRVAVATASLPRTRRWAGRSDDHDHPDRAWRAGR